MIKMIKMFPVLFVSLLFFNAKCDGSYQHFAIKQCAMEHNCVNHTNSILIAIDGTGSRLYFEESSKPRKYKSEVGINHNKQFIWQSHVANFWEDYQGESHYFFGPDSDEMIHAGHEMDETVENGHKLVCEFINKYFKRSDIVDEISSISSWSIPNFLKKKTISSNDDFGIDIIGFSRGGFAAMELSRKLQREGCNINNQDIKPIAVRWMGLYDPVERDIDISDLYDGYDDNEIAENVIAVSIAERSKFMNSRSYFGYAVDDDSHNSDKKRFDATHSAIGGQPAGGDCKENYRWHDFAAILCSNDYTDALDKIGAISTEIWMRSNAIKANVPIIGVINNYFGNFINMPQ